ncbi:30S ribosome-binding factor RbfA [Euzebya tangerina]|uniref:30S ribosome-binding factor RbfA n=1 Tax=Euzebya tangerina TaxID=591198 RepID=UPI000E30D460|nr:30S ribosome-binding factor RbfA [Euzebya tangerina]
MSAPERGRRLGERVKEIISSQIPTLKDPRVGFVTVTDVRMSGDNERATIYYTVLPDTEEQRRSTAAGLASATGLLRRDLGRALTVRHIPELSFELDDVAERGRRVEQILAGLDADADEGDTLTPDSST